MTDALVSEPFVDEFWWDDYSVEAPTAATVRYWRYTTAGGKEYLQSDESSFAAGVHDFTATSLGGGGFQFISASLATGFQGLRIHREARATGPLPSYPIQPWDGFVTANDEDDAKAATGTLQSDFDAFEITNQAEHDATQSLIATETSEIDADLALIKDNNVGDFDGATDSLRALRDENKAEHDTTQSKVDQIGAAAEARLTGPATFEIPDTGSSTFVLRFVLRDLDQSPSALVDPDTNVADISVIDQSGGAPTGVTLAGTPAGRMTRDSQGRYSLVVTVDDTAVDETQLRFTADYTYLGTSNVALHDTILGDFDQLDRIESNTDTLLNRVGTPGDAVDDPTLFGQHYDTQADIATVDNVVDTIRANTRTKFTAFAHTEIDRDGGQGRLGFKVVDAENGQTPATDINVASATASIQRSSAGSGFTLISNPTVSKSNGQVAFVFDPASTPWLPGDTALVDLEGVTITDPLGNTIQAPDYRWVITVTEEGRFTSQIDEIRTTDVPAIQQNIDDEHTTTRTLIQDETDAIDAVLATIQETGDGGFNRETDSLEAIRDRIDAIDAATNPTTISDAVWDEATASHVAAGSFGEEVQSHLTRSEATTDKNEVKTHVTTEHNTTRALITDIQSGTRLRHSWTSIGDAGIDGGQVRLRVNLTDDTSGDVPSASIDITAATAILERSRAGAAFTATGITQPTIAKENGGVIVEFDLVGTEWRPGDEAHLTLKGVKASSRFIPAASWLFQPNAAGGFTPDFGG